MKRAAPILLAVAALAMAKKKAMMAGGHAGFRHDRRERWEERARAWHEAQHEVVEA